MLKIKSLAIGVLAFTSIALTNCGNHNSAPTSEYSYDTIANDPLKTRIYTLKNGLKVYLSVNSAKPRVSTDIAVRAGSKYDPSDATGLAHYLEHMVFKGNSQIASLDWESEKVLLQQISDLYEAHRNTNDSAQKQAYYHQIDSISFEASKLVVTNEYDKMVSSLGAQGTNAYTSNERTVYVNDIPSTEIEKWMVLESARFKELALRIFHTELEAVYEEFNRGQDNDYRNSYQAIFKALFPTHPYGTQTTIGTGEHLKNPSMVKIHDYFNTYYVPNNMAICMAGDLNPDSTIAMIDKYFGTWQPKDVPTYTPPVEKPLDSISIDNVYGPMSEWVTLGYRFNGAKSEDEAYLTLLSQVMSNGKAGVLDLDLIKKQKVLSANMYPYVLKDYSMMMLMANPKEGQSLEEAKDLLLAAIEKVKTGDFDDWLIEACINDLKLQDMKYYEYNNYRTSLMVDAFILEKNWDDVILANEHLTAITKEKLVAFVNKNFNNNYAVVYKRNGKNTNAFKVAKPTITPISINRDTSSVFAKRFDSIPSLRLTPQFLDYSIIKHENLGDVQLDYVYNNENELFYLYYVFDMGSDNDKLLPIALNYLPFLGTDKYTSEELSKELFKLGVEFEVFNSNDRTYVYLSGLKNKMAEGMELFESLLANAQPNQEALNELIADELKNREDNKKSKWSIQSAMTDYAKYGPNSSTTFILNEKELKAIQPEQLTAKIHDLLKFKHSVYYFGNHSQDEAKTIVAEKHKVTAPLTDVPQKQAFAQLEIKNQVYFTNYDMVQVEMRMVAKDQSNFDANLLAPAYIFNEYFGSGLSSMIFQEIRESKALAYSAYSYFSNPSQKDEAHYVIAYIGTQLDKLPNASEAMLYLMNNMPESPKAFEDSKIAALKTIETNRSSTRNIYWSYLNNTRLGYDYDYKKDIYDGIQKLTLTDLKTFFDGHIKGKEYTYLVVGNKGAVDMKVLKTLGPVNELTLEQIFGY